MSLEGDLARPDYLLLLARLEAFGDVRGCVGGHDLTLSGMHCLRCRQRHRMNVRPLVWTPHPDAELAVPHVREDWLELGEVAVLEYECVACLLKYTAVVHRIAEKGSHHSRLTLTVIPRDTVAGSDNTPASVGYYLQQALASASSGAFSAAVAMYRSALEMLLHEQGFTKGMLGQKIEAVTKANPPWLQQLDPHYMVIIKKLGNGAIHANDGDITRQEALDAQLCNDAQIVMDMIIDVVYERPARDAARKARLSAAADELKP